MSSRENQINVFRSREKPNKAIIINVLLWPNTEVNFLTKLSIVNIT